MTSFVKTHTKFASSDPQQRKITDALVMFVASDLLPISIVESSHFRHLLECRNSSYEIPSRPHFKLLKSKTSEILQKLKLRLHDAVSVNLIFYPCMA